MVVGLSVKTLQASLGGRWLIFDGWWLVVDGRRLVVVLQNPSDKCWWLMIGTWCLGVDPSKPPRWLIFGG